MSVRDYNKVLDFKNMTTGEIFERFNFDDENFDNIYNGEIFMKIPVGDIRLLRAVHDAIDQGHGVLISIGYKK